MMAEILIFILGICHHISTRGFPGGSAVKNPPPNAGEAGSVPGSGRSPGEGHGNPPQQTGRLQAME